MSDTKQIIISKDDLKELENLFVNHAAYTISDITTLQQLRGELDIATIVASEEVPPDVVTLNSTVRLCDLRSSYEDSYTLVYPEDASTAHSKLSVLAPIGTAILGFRVGDLVQ